MKNTFLTGAFAFTLIRASLAWADMTKGDVLNDLHHADQMEIHMGKLAQEKGSTEDMRNYGKRLVSDDQDNDMQVMDLAAKEGVTLQVTESGVLDKIEVKHLRGLSGSAFDQKFAKLMIDAHKKDIAKMESAQKSPLPDDVRKLVVNTVPTLQKHLEMAQKIYGQPS